jgi:nucleotide-binding universal stress UspA family protein
MSATAPRVIVGVSGSLANLAALHVAMTQARLWQRRLLAVNVCPPVTGNDLDVQHAREERAVGVLVQALRDGFGELPTDVDIDLRIAMGEPAACLVAIARRPGDLLVIGESRAGLRRLRRPSISRYCRDHAQQLIVVPRPFLLEELGQLRHIRDIAGLAAL